MTAIKEGETLLPLARSLMALCRFGTQTLTLTKDEKGKKLTGKYQVRFINGANLSWKESELEKAEALLDKVNEAIHEDTRDYRLDILEDMKQILSTAQVLTAQSATDFEELAEHYDAIRVPAVIIQRSGEIHRMGLNSEWGMFLRGSVEKAKETEAAAHKWADAIQNILGLIRDYPLEELRNEVNAFLEAHAED